MRFYALPNASVGHKNIFTVIIRYMKGGNRLSNVRVTGDQTAEVLVLPRKKSCNTHKFSRSFKYLRIPPGNRPKARGFISEILKRRSIRLIYDH